jgi:NitT/TauT family transport system substrate-binding protein
MSIDEIIPRMKGLVIGVSAPGSGTDMVIRRTLLTRGVDPDKGLTLQYLGGSAPILAAFQNGLIDGFVYTSPVVEMAEAHGLGKIVIDTFRGDVPELTGVPFMVLVTSRSTLESENEKLAAMTRSMTRAMRFAQANPDKVRTLLRAFFPDIDEAIYNKMIDSYLKVSPKTAVITKDDLDRTAKWASIGGAAVKIPFETVVDDKLAKAAEQLPK